MAAGIPPQEIPLSGIGSYAIWPVNTGAAGNGPAWVNIVNDTNGARYAVRVWCSVGDGQWAPLGPNPDGVYALGNAERISLQLADRMAALSVSRMPLNPGEQPYQGHLTFCVEYGRRG